MIAFIISTACLSIIFFGLFLYLSSINYKKRFSNKYNIKNMFPYEFNFESSFKDNLYGNIALIISALTSLLFFVFACRGTTNGAVIFLLISGALASALYPFVAFVNVKYLKLHLAVDIIYFLAVFMTLCSSGIVAFAYYRAWDDLDPVCLTFFIIAMVFALVFFVILLNPRLTTWAKLNEEKQPDGTVIYVRPKYFPLAFTEWLAFFFHFIAIVIAACVYSLGVF